VEAAFSDRVPGYRFRVFSWAAAVELAAVADLPDAPRYLWWDGDITMELLNDGKFEKWDPNDPRPTNSLPRLLSTWNYGAVDASQGVQPTFYGDILGDWRLETRYVRTLLPALSSMSPGPPTPAALSRVVEATYSNGDGVTCGTSAVLYKCGGCRAWWERTGHRAAGRPGR
jgi:hypothetical protein